MNIIDVYPDTAVSAHSSFKSLSFPPILSIDQLLGKSNFKSWRSSIEPVLLANTLSSKLVLGDWPEPSRERAASSAFAFDNPTVGVAQIEQERSEWHTANAATCRFIRATLALNVAPFVRQHNTAKALYLNIIWLYGDEAGIDTQGGPPVPADAHFQNTMQQKTRAGLLAALENRSCSITPYGQVAAAAGGRLSPSPNVSSNNSSTLSLLAGPSSSPAASRSVLDVSRPDSQALPARDIPMIAPPPPALVHIYERTRQSPDPSLDTIHEHEEPHPGRRVSFGHCSRSRSGTAGSGSEEDISPLSLSEMSVEDDDDDDHDHDVELSPRDDVQGHTRQADRNRDKDNANANNNGQSGSRSKSIFGRNFGREPTKTRKLSFSFPLRRLHKDKEKAKEEGKTKARG